MFCRELRNILRKAKLLTLILEINNNSVYVCKLKHSNLLIIYSVIDIGFSVSSRSRISGPYLIIVESKLYNHMKTNIESFVIDIGVQNMTNTAQNKKALKPL